MSNQQLWKLFHHLSILVLLCTNSKAVSESQSGLGNIYAKGHSDNKEVVDKVSLELSPLYLWLLEYRLG